MAALALEPLWTTLFVVVALCWAVFWSAIFARAGLTAAASAPGERKRDPGSVAGAVLQGASYMIVGVLWRRPFSAVAMAGTPLAVWLALLGMGLAVLSAALVATAVRTLGRQWSLTARVLSEHQLITAGPYRFVRNPIYSGMLGMLVASALAWSQWWALLPALLVFFAGTRIRVRAEERLLREVFGTRYDEYARRVPALIPFVA